MTPGPRRDDDWEVVGEGLPDSTLVETPGRGASWLWWLLVVVALVVAGVLVANHGRDDDSQARSLVTPTTSSPATASLAEPPTDKPVTRVSQVGHPLLDGATGWEVIARGPGVLTVIDPASGTITTTSTPGIDQDSVAFVASAKQALLRPIDGGAGYRVPNGDVPVPLTEAFTGAGSMLPGPDPDHVWLTGQRDGHPALVLTEIATGIGGEAIPLGDDPLSAVPDGRGNVLFTAMSGVYAAQPGQPRPTRLGPGILLAVGPTWALLSSCDVAGVCHLQRVDRATGAARDVGERSALELPLGAISPDGNMAGLFEYSSSGPHLLLLDLDTGTRRRLPIRGGAVGVIGSVAWSPDNRYLLAVTDAKAVSVVDTLTARIETLGTQMPPITQLAVVATGRTPLIPSAEPTP